MLQSRDQCNQHRIFQIGVSLGCWTAHRSRRAMQMKSSKKYSGNTIWLSRSGSRLSVVRERGAAARGEHRQAAGVVRSEMNYAPPTPSASCASRFDGPVLFLAGVVERREYQI